MVLLNKGSKRRGDSSFLPCSEVGPTEVAGTAWAATIMKPVSDVDKVGILYVEILSHIILHHLLL